MFLSIVYKRIRATSFRDLFQLISLYFTNVSCAQEFTIEFHSPVAPLFPYCPWQLFSSKTPIAKVFTISQNNVIGTVCLGDTGSGIRDMAWLPSQVCDTAPLQSYGLKNGDHMYSTWPNSEACISDTLGPHISRTFE